jgi:hypothetical protein
MSLTSGHRSRRKPALGPAGAGGQAPATADQYLEDLMIENADTPEEHTALARYFRMKAAEAKALAEKHRTMGRNYRQRPKPLPTMKKHCDRIAELNEELAAQYEELAKGEDAAAGPS